ncbi:hypothetical protein ACS0TY_014384 [Phlomoides rotata]
MEKGKKIDATKGEILLPEAIIHHIQSLLGRKLAAQTSILSKSWYSAWSTRPHLVFDQRFFQNRGHGDPNPPVKDGFSEFAKMTVQRYEELKLKVESLKLCMEITETDSYLLANELIVKAIMMGATDIDFEFLPQNDNFSIPVMVLGFENLVRLSVAGCKIDREVDGKVSFSRLKSLSLCRVHAKREIIWDTISSCPLIENLLLCDCKYDNKMLKLSPSIEFHKLKCLSLEKVKVDGLFFKDFSLRFPYLKDFTLHHCFGYRAIQLHSNSLESMSIAQDRMLFAELNFPSIRKFSFSGSSIPNFSIVTSSTKWESDISITCPGTPLGAQWFHTLKLLLRKLTPSKVSLSLNIGFFLESSFDYTGVVQSLSKPVVENLTLTMDVPPLVCSALLEGVFWSCCPKQITQYWLPKSCLGRNANRDFLEVLCKSLIQEVSENVCVPNRIMFGLLDLEEVNVEIFEDSLSEWWLLHWKTLLDASAFPEHKRKIRFQLRWR